MLSCGRRSRPLHPELLDSVLSPLAFHRGRGLWHLIKTPWGFQNFSIGLHFRPQCQVLGGLFLQASFRDHVVRLDHVISLRLLTDSCSMGPKLPQELGLSLAHWAQPPAHRSHTTTPTPRAGVQSLEKLSFPFPLIRCFQICQSGLNIRGNVLLF